MGGACGAKQEKKGSGGGMGVGVGTAKGTCKLLLEPSLNKLPLSECLKFVPIFRPISISGSLCSWLEQHCVATQTCSITTTPNSRQNHYRQRNSHENMSNYNFRTTVELFSLRAQKKQIHQIISVIISAPTNVLVRESTSANSPYFSVLADKHCQNVC